MTRVLLVCLGLLVASTARAADGLAEFLRVHCTRCHNEKKAAGEFSFASLDPTMQAAKDAAAWRKVGERIRSGEMPPEDQPRPEAKAARRAVAAIADQLAKHKHDVGILRTPIGGNHIPHADLFDPSRTADVGLQPPRVWRVRPQIYTEMLNEFAKGKSGLAQPFASDARQAFKDTATGTAIDEPTTSLLIRNATAIVEHQTRFKMVDGKPKGENGSVKEFLALLDPSAKPTTEAERAAIARQFDIVLRRKPTSEETDRFQNLLTKTTADAGREQGVKTMLAAVLLLPEAVFRLELGAGPVDGQGRRKLAPRELAFAIAYALTDRRPDRMLLEAAEKGQLTSAADVEQQVRRILADPKIEKARLPRFFREYFGYHTAGDVFKDTKDFPQHDAPVLVRDTDQLVQWVLDTDRDVLKQLLTTNKSFVNYRFDTKKKIGVKANNKDIHKAYGLTAWPEQQPAELAVNERAGILTQPSWLVAHSLNADNHPILRGKWIRERLLGGTVPDLPITVDAVVPEDPHKTLRERLTVTKQDYCWQCHQRMNPLGLPFEMFDHFGRFRSEELRKPVDATGTIDRTGVTALEGDVPNAVAMLQKLADSPHVRQVFVRHAFRYWMGRDETPGDASVLRAADAAYVKSNGSLNALVVSLLTSDAFLYRAAEYPKSP